MVVQHKRHDEYFLGIGLVKPPFLDESEAREWAGRSVSFAFDCGASVVSLIPTRLGNGALESLAARGDFAPPKLATFGAAFDDALTQRRGRVFADTWDLERFSNCPACCYLAEGATGADELHATIRTRGRLHRPRRIGV